MPITTIKQLELDTTHNHVICYLANDLFLIQKPLMGLCQEWTDLKYDYFRWKGGKKREKGLGSTRAYQVDLNIWCFGIIAFRGYAKDVKGGTPFRQNALIEGLKALSDFATEKGAIVHFFDPSNYWKSLPWSFDDCNVYMGETGLFAEQHKVVRHNYLPIL